ncbi:MAG: phage portal protein [Pseudomonadota bacterium]
MTSNRLRRAKIGTAQSEDAELTTSERRTLVATPRDQRRNFAVLSWAIRQHLDFVSRFEFHAGTPSAEFNKQLERLWRYRCRRENWDVAGRFGQAQFTRLLEACRFVDGDCGVLHADGALHQAIEGDRITEPTKGAKPAGYVKKEWTHGVQVDPKTGAPLNYCVCTRDGSSFVYDATVKATDISMLAYLDRFDQVRGVSPLAAAINTVMDVSESLGHALSKAKMHAMLGFFFKRQATNAQDFPVTDADTGEAPDGDTQRYEFELKSGLKIEGMPGDELDVIESRQPSQEFRDYEEMMIRIILNACDLPYTFWDVRASTYAGQRMDLVRYFKSCETKRDGLIEFLSEVLRRDLIRWANTPDPETKKPPLFLPTGSKVWEIVADCEFVASGVPWVDPLKEVQADMLAVAAGFDTRDAISKRRTGRSYLQNVQQLGREEAAAVEASATIAIGQPGQITTRDEEADNPAGATEGTAPNA